MWLLIVCTIASASDLVMLGNSYTFYNDLPAALQQTLRAGEHADSVASLTAGGLKLPDHVSRIETGNAQWQGAFDGDTWSTVILQDQSQIPGFPESSPEKAASLEAATTLNGHARDAGADTLFFLTWGRRDGDAGNTARYPDFPTMQNHLDEGYIAYRDRVSTPTRPAWVAPVGPAFRKVYEDDGADALSTDSQFYALYSTDGSHPSAAGTALAAYVFYATLTGCDPTGLDSKLVDTVTGAYLQGVAKSVVLDGEDGGLGLKYAWGDSPCGSDPESSGEDSPEAPEAPAVDAASCGCLTAPSPLSVAWLLLPIALRRREAPRLR
ncbi:MAG: hypothetical protein KC912_07195 [Proteobacteria bacterium]|nr:hypothetical protein [Pseudomonadota bacterium]